MKQTAPGDRERRPVRPAEMLHQNRGHIGADGVEGTMAKRDLAVVAGEDVQAQQDDGVHQHHVELEHAIVADQEGQRHS